MNYKQSDKILYQIKKADNILLNCHKGPDPDSIGSALALYEVLNGMKKKSEIICPSSIPNDIKFLKNYKKIRIVNFIDFDFSKYDLFVLQDSAGWYMVSGVKNIQKPDIPLIVIDHHKTNEYFGDINLIDSEISSNAELLYNIFEDWKVKIDKETALCLLTGIIADTGVFRYPGTTARTLEIASKLIKKGADNNLIVSNIYFDTDFKVLKFYGEILHTMQFDEEYKFIWSATPYEKFKEFGSNSDAKSMAAGAFAQSVSGANFGFVMVEDSEKRLSISIRSKKGYDISKLAVKLGGGGHESAAGAKVEGMEFDQAVEKVLDVAREFAKKNE